MGKYVLSPNAQESLKGIKAWSTEKFGARQTNIYLENLRARMRLLADNPKLGRARNEIKRGYFSYFEGSHTIYYKILADRIAVIDVLHQSMEPMRRLLKDDPETS